MKLTPIKFYWTALAVTTIAFTFSLFTNPTTDDNTNTILSDTVNVNTTSDMIPVDGNKGDI